MSARVLDGIAVANQIRSELVPVVAAFTARVGRPPGLGIVLVGDDPASHVYVGAKLKSIRHDYSHFNWIMTGTDMFAVEGTSYGEHQGGEWRAGVSHAGRWCDVFEIRDFLIQRCFIYLDPDYAGKDTARYPWLAGKND